MSNKVEITKSAVRLRAVVWAAMAALVLVHVVARLQLQPSGVHIHYRNGLTGPWAGAVSDISLALLIVALWSLASMLTRIASGDHFSTGVIRHFRRFALLLLLMALFQFAAPIAAAVAAAARSRLHDALVPLDLRDLLTVGITLVLFLIAHLLEQARRIDEEMREFV